MVYAPPRRPINLGMQSLQLGHPQMMQPPQGKVMLGNAGQGVRPPQSNAALYGIAEAIASDPISVESGTFSEGLAEGLERFMVTRAATQRARAEEDDRERERKREQGELDREQRRAASLSEALTAFNANEGENRWGDLVTALAPDNPELALEIARERAEAEREQEQWSEPFQLDGAWVRRNLRTGETVQVVGRRPQGRAGSEGDPPLPDGAVWID